MMDLVAAQKSAARAHLVALHSDGYEFNRFCNALPEG
jgi:hypothetical protein